MNNTRKTFRHSTPRNRFTHHASERCRQRGISQQTIELILTHGKSRWVRGGCHSISLTRAAIDRLRFTLPKAEIIQMEKQLGVYLIVDDQDGAILTAAWSKRHAWC